MTTNVPDSHDVAPSAALDSAPRMTSAQIKTHVIATSMSPTLPPFDACALARCLVDEIEASPGLSASARGVLIGAAAVLLKYGRDEQSAECEAKDLFGRAAASRGAGMH